ncbi:MAG: alpha/beta-type small acid-soluble spore protein [Firmicutes bacterium]|nr:alpha/beta-type small acid-soluble spore protein [Bacillota bacterium]
MAKDAGKERRATGGGGRAEEPTALDDLKQEVAEEVGVDPDKYGGNVPAKKWGALGGHMVRRLIRKGEEALGRKGPDQGSERSRT